MKTICTHPRTRNGFTIVELIVVIVVIGILAAVSLVSYQSVQRDARNSARITAANQVINSIKIYKSYNQGSYPMGSAGNTNVTSCITTSVAGQAWPCTDDNTTVKSVDTTFLNNLKSVSDLPTQGNTIVSGGSTWGGIFYYNQGGSYNSDSTKYGVVMYYLEGLNQNCNSPDIAQWDTGPSGAPTPKWGTPTAGTNYTTSYGNVTTCLVAV
jgi:prepilin-type N-terminal cleavage/methylation domain-containing protein